MNQVLAVMAAIARCNCGFSATCVHPLDIQQTCTMSKFRSVSLVLTGTVTEKCEVMKMDFGVRLGGQLISVQGSLDKSPL
jgi:hypothetical protein